MEFSIKQLHLHRLVQDQLAFLQVHLVPHPFSLLQLHFTSSMHALEAIGRMVQTGIHSFPHSSHFHPQDSGVGYSC